MTISNATIKELKERNGDIDCDISKAVLNQWNEDSLPNEEQELHVWDGRDDEKIRINSSHGPWNTQLRQNKHFHAEEILVTESNRILQMKGWMEKGRITIRGRYT